MWSVGLVVFLVGVLCWDSALPDREADKSSFPLNNLCKVYGNKNRDKKIECRNCFRNATRNASGQNEDVSETERQCILLLPNSFQECSSDEDVRECLKDKIKIYFKHKFHRFWKKWKDVFNETERGRIHQVFSFKTILRKIGEESKDQLNQITQAFSACIDPPINLSNDSHDLEEGRNINGLDALDYAALEGTEDEDEENFREERAEGEFPDGSRNGTDQQKVKYDEEVGVEVDAQEEQEFTRKKQKLGRYIDRAYHVFLCKVKVIKHNESFLNIVKEALKTYEDVVPAELVRALYQG